MKPIYQPKGHAKEYGDLAINIYSGCNHGCTYCYAPLVLKKSREDFHGNVAPRSGIIEAVKRQLDKEQITGKSIHLCFTSNRILPKLTLLRPVRLSRQSRPQCANTHQ